MKHDLKILAAASLGLLSVTSTAFAADAAAPTLGSVLEASGITATGYVAASYYHSTAENTFHNFDAVHDTFQLDQAGLTLAYQPKEGFGALAQVIAGEDATLLSTTHPTTFSVAQAYVQYAGGPLTLIAGKYWTLAGAEVTPVTGNTNFSRSLLFTFEPAYHTGVRATIAASDTLSFIVGVNNGWNYDKVFSTGAGTNASMKTGELGISFTPVKAFALTAQGYFGKDPTWDANRTLVDLVATINATDALSFVVSVDHGSQEFEAADQAAMGTDKASWDGVAGYVNVALTDQFRLSVRGEYFKDKDGFNSYIATAGNSALLGHEVKLREATVTLGYAPVKSFEWRAEVRYDKSNTDAAFPDGVFTKTDGTATDSQTEFALQGVYKF